MPNQQTNNKQKREFREKKLRETWRLAENLKESFYYAWQGIVYTFWSERNFKLHLFAALSVISLSFFLKLSNFEIALLVLTSFLVLSMEIMNTAVEMVVDLLTEKKYHYLAKIAKDCSAGAVLVLAIAAIIIGFLVIFPYFFKLFVNF